MVCLDAKYVEHLKDAVRNAKELTEQEIADLMWGVSVVVHQQYIGENKARQQIKSIIYIDGEYYAVNWVRTPHKVYFENQPYKVKKPEKMNCRKILTCKQGLFFL